MPASVMAWAAPAVLGGLGLLQNQDAQRRANNQAKKGQDATEQGLQWQNLINELQYPAMQANAKLAKDYDPIKEAQGTVDAATPIFEQSLRRALGEFGAKDAYGGMNQGNSTEGQIRQAKAVRGPANAFEALVADAFSNPTAKKMAAYQGVLGMPAGNLTSGYFNAAQNFQNLSQANQSNFGPSAQLLSMAFQDMFKQQPSNGASNGKAPSTGSKGLSGSGDVPYYDQRQR